MGLRLNMALGSQTGRKVGGLVRVDDHDVAVTICASRVRTGSLAGGASTAPGAEIEPGCVKGAVDPGRQSLCIEHLFYVQGIKFAPSGLGRDRSA